MARIPAASFLRRANAETLLFGLILAAYITPLWTSKYVPTEEGPAHLGNAYIIREFADPEATLIRATYRLPHDRPTNVGYQYVLAGLLFAFPPLLAEKVFLTGIVVFFALAFRRLVVTACGRPEPAATLAIPFIFGYPFFEGSFGWTVAAALAFAAAVYYWRRRDALTGVHVGVLNALGLLAFWFHVLGWVLWAAGLLYLNTTAGMDRLLRDWRGGPARPGLGGIWKRLSALPFYILPVLLIGGWYFFTVPDVGPPHRLPLTELWDNFRTNAAITSFNDIQKYVAVAAAAFLAFGILVFFVERHIFKNRPEVNNEVRWRRRDVILLGALVAAVGGYFALPDAGPLNIFGMNGRFLQITFMMAVVVVAAVGVGWFRRVVWVAAPVIAAVNLVGLVMGISSANATLRDFTDCLWAVRPASAVYVITAGGDLPGALSVDYTGNAGAYYALGNRCVDLGNRAANFRYTPVGWRESGPPQPTAKGLAERWTEIDYVVLWRLNPRARGFKPVLDKHFELIHWTPDLAVWARRPAEASPR